VHSLPLLVGAATRSIMSTVLWSKQF